MINKKCTRCHKIKAIDLFHRNATKPDGHEIYCKVCVARRNKIKNSAKEKHPSWTCEYCGHVEQLKYHPRTETLRWLRELCKKCMKKRFTKEI